MPQSALSDPPTTIFFSYYQAMNMKDIFSFLDPVKSGRIILEIDDFYLSDRAK
jgi:hypothetical protein